MCGRIKVSLSTLLLFSMQNWIRRCRNSHSRTAMPNYWSGPPRKTSASLGDTARNIRIIETYYENKKMKRLFRLIILLLIIGKVLLRFFAASFAWWVVETFTHFHNPAWRWALHRPVHNDPPPWLIWVESHHIVAFLLWGKVDEDSVLSEKNNYILKICIAILR